MASQDDAGGSNGHHTEKSITVHIDRAEFKVTAESMSGAQLRDLPTPPIGPDRDLYLEVAGPGNDELISDDQVVRLEDGMRFFTAPHAITPG